MDSQLSFRSAWRYGALALLLPAPIGLGLRLAGMAPDIVAVVLIAGATGGVVVVILSISFEKWPVWLAALILMLVAPLGAVGVAEGQAVGPILRVAAGQAAAHRLAAGFVFTDDAAPRLDLQQTVTVGEFVPSGRAPRGGSSSAGNLPQMSNAFFSYAVVPVVPPGWTPEQPVRVVAVEGDRSMLSVRPDGTAQWAAPGGLLRRLSEDREIRAVRLALGRRGLIAAPDMVIGLWVPSPGWARLDAVLPSFLLLAVALALWTGVLLLSQPGAMGRARRR